MRSARGRAAAGTGPLPPGCPPPAAGRDARRDDASRLGRPGRRARARRRDDGRLLTRPRAAPRRPARPPGRLPAPPAPARSRRPQPRGGSQPASACAAVDVRGRLASAFPPARPVPALRSPAPRAPDGYGARSGASEPSPGHDGSGRRPGRAARGAQPLPEAHGVRSQGAGEGPGRRVGARGRRVSGPRGREAAGAALGAAGRH